MATSKGTFAAFDWLRLVAIAFVALHHALIAGYYPSAWHRLEFGQLGVGIFCAISGFLALHDASGNNGLWFRRRMTKVFIPYWISLAPLFLANAWLEYEPAEIDLIIAEFCGVGLFTHRNQLVGEHVWFISLIVVCYCFAYFMRSSKVAFVAAIVAACLFSPWFPRVGAHLIGFVGGATLACIPNNRRIPFALVFGAVLGIAWWVTGRFHLAYPLVSVLLTASTSMLVAPRSSLISKLSEATYEFYLVNTPLYLLVGRYFSADLLVILLAGTALSIVATVILRAIAGPLVRAAQPSRPMIAGAPTAS